MALYAENFNIIQYGLIILDLGDCQIVENIAAVIGNPFASGFVDNFDEHDFLKGNGQIITPCPPQDASGNRLELKLTRTPKIAPPPEFRNSKSYRDSQCSFQSQRARHRRHSSVYTDTRK